MGLFTTTHRRIVICEMCQGYGANKYALIHKTHISSVALKLLLHAFEWGIMRSRIGFYCYFVLVLLCSIILISNYLIG